MNNLLTMNSIATPINANGTVSLGTAIHGYGKSIKLNGNQVSICTPGYYYIDVSTSIAVTGTDTIAVQLYENGVAIPGAWGAATPGSAGDTVNISFGWMYRKTGCACNPSNLSLVVNQAGTVGDVIMLVSQEI